MATILRDYEIVHGETHVERVTIIETVDPTYPSGWKYALHYGEIGGGKTVIRYDNAHERTKGHERHTSTGVETIDFPGMEVLYRRFIEEITRHPP